MFKVLFAINLIFVILMSLSIANPFMIGFAAMLTVIIQIISLIFLILHWKFLKKSILNRIKIYVVLLAAVLICFYTCFTIIRGVAAEVVASMAGLMTIFISYYFIWILWWTRNTQVKKHTNPPDVLDQ
jgi:hypothetical protein